MSAQLKAAKDALVSSLYELSKAANDASAATVNFYNASLNTDEDATKIFADLADSLKLLTRASEGVSASAHTIAGDAILPMFSDITGDVGVPDVVLPSQPASTKPKRAQAEKDPYAPKKPLTMFFAYSSYIRESIRAERAAKGEPPLSSTEVTKAISDRWGSLSDEEKEKWKEAYTKELATYQELKEKYIEDKKNGALV
ncbi:High mobility group protein 1 [Cyberlindnera fabianii]|uniref:High mobility group protein 1 n=1 Tax=Cyberlindnera fabianii TaxID=36022 RepID=A0A1V2L168_CYBFA|nr:High mobility group protein 1 [Cyberlindnera fabianii]